ncbi:unnamed protein product [Caenorhabditis auriculariae]|uniref:Uncharacterized protein n=1 Tax=Caenorhabditis auriculariae TaxID=2777116 RepID=A0A8S1GW25_9PELO|nr:unnamed protein product [Caenorhabditis auriculariae]
MDLSRLEMLLEMNKYPNCENDPQDSKINILRSVEIALAFLFLPLSLTSLYCILFKSSKSMRTYRWYQLNYQIWVLIWDFLFSICITPIFYFPATAGCSIGFFQSVGISPKIQLLCSYFAFGNMIVALVLLFMYRHYCVLPGYIRIRIQKSTYFLYWLAVCILFSGALVGLFLNIPTNQVEAQVFVVKSIGCRPARIFTECALVVDTSYVNVTFIAISTSIILAHVVFFAVHSIYILNNQQIIMSDKTRKIQKAFLSALCIQVSVPSMFLIMPFFLIVVLVYAGKFLPSTSSLIVIWITLHGGASPCGFTLGLVSNGPCKYFGRFVCFTTYSFMLHCLSHTLWSLLLSFAYRYYILHHSAPKRRTLIILLFLIYIPSFLQFISYLFSYDPPEKVTKLLEEKFPSYSFEGETVTGNASILNFFALYVILHMTLPVTPVYIAIIIFRKKIIKVLEHSESQMAKRTKTLHAQLLKALTYQACMPGFYWFAVVSYSIGQFGIYNHPFLEYFTFTSTLCISVFSPVSYLCFFGHYRTYCLNKLRQILLCGSVEPERPPISKVTSAVSSAEQH